MSDATTPTSPPSPAGPPAPESPASPFAVPAAFPAPPEFTVGAAPVPAPPPAFAAPDPAYAAPDPAYAASAPPYAIAGAPAYPAYPAPLPVPVQPGYGGYGGYGGAPGGYYPGYAPAPKTNGMAVASMSTSIAAAALLFCYGLGTPVGIVGAILGHVARRQLRTREESGDGMALAGIIIGWVIAGIGLAFIAVVVVFFFWAASVSTTPPPPAETLRLLLRG